MPLQKLIFKSGVTRQATQTLADGTWSYCDRIRWRDGYLEKLGGWQRLTTVAVDGTARTLHAFEDLNRIIYLAIGTNTQLEVWSAGSLTDITPLRDTANVAVNFSTVLGSTTVTIVDAANGAAEDDQIVIYVPVSVGGIVLQGTYTITSIVDANTYTIEAAAAATSTVNNGGAVPSFATVDTTPTITVTLANHGNGIGNVFTVQVSTAVGGLTISGEYIVDTTPTVNTFTVVASGNATSTTSGSENGGNARFFYLISPGPVSTLTTQGYGSGTYGSGGYGTGSGATVAAEPLRYWSLDNWEETLVASPTNLGIYAWIPPVTATNRATIIAGAPIYNTGMFVAMPQLQIMAYGTEVLGTQDPQLIRWCDTGDYTDWIATSTNQAGSYHLSSGSRIVGGLQAQLSGLFWTNIDLWQAQYVGPPFIYSFTKIGDGCGLIAQFAMGSIGRDVYWMSQQGFFVYGSGIVQPVPCAVWDQIFVNLDIANQDKCIAATNAALHEIAWYYPSTDGDGEIDSYAKLNILTGDWDYGSLVRTGWIDQNLFGNPLGIDENGIVQQHELGYDADGDPMTGVFAESGFVDIPDGTDLMVVDQIIPDFVLRSIDDANSPEISVIVYGTDYPGNTPTSRGPYTVTPTTAFINLSPAMRARQLAYKVTCDAEDTFFRWGASRVRAAPAGRR